MLYLFTKDSPRKAIEWHVGSCTLSDIIPGGATEVIEISADGDELRLINQTIDGIPKAMQRMVTWRGDWAVFIAENL